MLWQRMINEKNRAGDAFGELHFRKKYKEFYKKVKSKKCRVLIATVQSRWWQDIAFFGKVNFSLYVMFDKKRNKPF